jgi:hypothetical protein
MGPGNEGKTMPRMQRAFFTEGEVAKVLLPKARVRCSPRSEAGLRGGISRGKSREDSGLPTQ